MNPIYIPLIDKALDLGVTAVVVIGVLAVIYLLGKLFLTKFLTKFLTTQQEMATAMGSQAQSMGDMKDAVGHFIKRDNMDHREILLTLQVVGDELKSVANRLEKFSDEQGTLKTLVTEMAENGKSGKSIPEKSNSITNLEVSC